MNFVAIDVETANADMASICQIGFARFKNGILSEEWKSYVDPEDYFDGMYVSIHGIDLKVAHKSVNRTPKSAAFGCPVTSDVRKWKVNE